MGHGSKMAVFLKSGETPRERLWRMVFALDRAIFGPCVFIIFMDVHHSDIPCLKVEYPIDHWSFYTAFACFRLADAWWNWWHTVGQNITLVTLTSRHLCRSSECNDIVISSTLVSGFWPVLTPTSISQEPGMAGIQTGCDIMAWRTAKLRTCWRWHILSSGYVWKWGIPPMK